LDQTGFKGDTVKKIEAIIRPEKFDSVKKALEQAGYTGVTLTEVEGHGKQKGLSQQFRGWKYKVEFLPKLKLEIVAPSGDIEKLVKAIMVSASTGQVGDGKIFVYNIEEAYRISSGEAGDTAVS
jgi:nitrogen regulatory protein P-II 1